MKFHIGKFEITFPTIQLQTPSAWLANDEPALQHFSANGRNNLPNIAYFNEFQMLLCYPSM
jgi:hypothetical protein